MSASRINSVQSTCSRRRIVALRSMVHTKNGRSRSPARHYKLAETYRAAFQTCLEAEAGGSRQNARELGGFLADREEAERARRQISTRI